MKKIFILPALFALVATGCGEDEQPQSVEWSQEIKAEMTEYLGLVLPYVQFDEATLYHEWSEEESGYFIGDDSEINVLDGYGDRLIRTGWTAATQEGYVNYTKSTEAGELTLHYEWYEATEEYPCGNEIAIYVDGGGVVPPGDDPVTGTYDFEMADYGWADTEVISSTSLAPGLTIDASKNGGSLNPKYYSSGASIRLYPSNTITFSADNLTKLEFTFTRIDDNFAFTPDSGTFEADLSEKTGVWTGNAASVTFTLGSTSGKQIRISKVTATGTFSGGSSPIVPTGDFTPTSVMQDLDKWAWPDEWAEDDINDPDQDGLVTCNYAITYSEDVEDTQECLEACLSSALSEEGFPSYLVADSEMGYGNNQAYIYYATEDYSVAVLFYDYYEDGQVWVCFEAAPYDYYE